MIEKVPSALKQACLSFCFAVPTLSPSVGHSLFVVIGGFPSFLIWVCAGPPSLAPVSSSSGFLFLPCSSVCPFGLVLGALGVGRRPILVSLPCRMVRTSGWGWPSRPGL